MVKEITITQSINGYGLRTEFAGFGDSDNCKNGVVVCGTQSVKATDFDGVFALTLAGQTFVIADMASENVTVNGAGSATDAVAEVLALL